VNDAFLSDHPLGAVVNYDRVRDLLATSPFPTPLSHYIASRITFARLPRTPVSSSVSPPTDFIFVTVRELGWVKCILFRDGNSLSSLLYTSRGSSSNGGGGGEMGYRSLKKTDSEIVALSVEVTDAYGNALSSSTDGVVFLKTIRIDRQRIILEMRNFLEDDAFLVGDVIILKDVEWFHPEWWAHWNSNDHVTESPFYLDPMWRQLKLYLERTQGHVVLEVTASPPTVTVVLPTKLNPDDGTRQILFSEVDCGSKELVNGLVLNRSTQVQVGVRFVAR
jgi:hypothetical protein